jgi:TIR domain
MTDFFVSYTTADKIWAEWIAYVLEEAGWSTIIQAWDFRPGSNFILEMQRAASEAGRTITVLSPDYLKSHFASSEWAAAFTLDPQGFQNKLVPIVVRRCEIRGLLKSVVHIDLTEKSEEEARNAVLQGIDVQRAKPGRRPSFPGSTPQSPRKTFPGSSLSAAPKAYVPALKRPSTEADKRRFAKQTFESIRSYFQNGLDELAQGNSALECDFATPTTAEFIPEIFLNGASRCWCRIWLGSMFSTEGISYSEARHNYGRNACNEILSAEECQGDLHLSSLIGLGYGRSDFSFDLKRMSPEQAAEYLWRRFVLPLER